MSDFEVYPTVEDRTRNVNQGPGTTGVMMASRRMLGQAGATATGVSNWYRSDGLWKTFFLGPQDRLQATGVGAAVVVIDACMELPDNPNDPDDAAYFELGTLNTSTRSISTENPWRWVRARVTTPAAFAVNVFLHEQGQG